MSAQASRAAAKPAIAKSGAAGSAVFPGSDSRKYNYFEPKGRKATHYEDMTVDVQPGILVIFGFREYFGHFLGFWGIFVIFWVLGVFWSFLGFRGILVIFWVLVVF